MNKNKSKATKPGIVQKIIKAYLPVQPEKAQISITAADELYREIRIENALIDNEGKEFKLKPGADVDVVVEADAAATEPKDS